MTDYSNITDAMIDAALERYSWPRDPTEEYAAKIARVLGVEPVRGCWRKQCSTPERQSLVERVIERAKTGDPAWAACLMVCDCGSPRKWDERVKATRMSEEGGCE